MNKVAISVSPDGGSFAPAVGGMTNEAVISAPVQGGSYTVPTGYRSRCFWAGDRTARPLSRLMSDGNALLVANSGNDNLIANAANDVLVAGSGNDSLFGGGFAGTVVGGSTCAPNVAGAELTVTEHRLLVFSGAGNNGSSIFGAAGAGADNLMASLSGAGQMASVGASTATAPPPAVEPM